MSSESQNRDQVYREELSVIRDFEFDENVTSVFDDMIHRSVPGYDAGLRMIGLISQKYATEASNLYDLGCSLGAVSLEMLSRVEAEHCTVHAIDLSESMIKRCHENLSKIPTKCSYKIIQEDIQNTEIKEASVVVLNFTLQFIPRDQRTDLLKRIYNGMLEKGVIIISEKIQFPDDKIQEDFREIYESFKKTRGYSELEISQKRTALEKILIPDTFETHESRLREAGFSKVQRWFQCLNFASMIAWK